MSYDLLVFDPANAPNGREPFMAWYASLTEWADEHGYGDPNATTPQLRAWYEEMRVLYPNMNGPGAPTDDDLMTPGLENRLIGYTIAKHAIYMTCAWSEAENIYPVVRDLVIKHTIGFYDVSGDDGDGEIYFPGDVQRPPSDGLWRDIAKQFRDLRQ